LVRFSVGRGPGEIRARPGWGADALQPLEGLQRTANVNVTNGVDDNGPEDW
jgi:hypothetical protein